MRHGCAVKRQDASIQHGVFQHRNERRSDPHALRLRHCIYTDLPHKGAVRACAYHGYYFAAANSRQAEHIGRIFVEGKGFAEPAVTPEPKYFGLRIEYRVEYRGIAMRCRGLCFFVSYVEGMELLYPVSEFPQQFLQFHELSGFHKPCAGGIAESAFKLGDNCLAAAE